MIKIGQRKLRDAHVSAFALGNRLETCCCDLPSWCRQIGEQSGICHRFVPMRSDIAGTIASGARTGGMERNMWSRNTISTALITDILDPHSVVLTSLTGNIVLSNLYRAAHPGKSRCDVFRGQHSRATRKTTARLVPLTPNNFYSGRSKTSGKQ